MMKTAYLKKWGLGLGLLFMTSLSYAEDWKMIDHYMVKGGLVKDLTTGLMWMRCSLGQTWNGSTCKGEAIEVKWEQAMAIPKNLGAYAGYSDWRMPTIKELKLLVYCSSGQVETYSKGRTSCKGDYHSPTIVENIFLNTPSYVVWSGSPVVGNPSRAWYVDFNNGFGSSSDHGGDWHVRLVRARQ